MKAEWTNEDQSEALLDGWGVFNNSDHGMRIERYDEAARFASDAAAQAYVAWRSMNDDPLAVKAIRYLVKQHFGA